MGELRDHRIELVDCASPQAHQPVGLLAHRVDVELVAREEGLLPSWPLESTTTEEVGELTKRIFVGRFSNEGKSKQHTQCSTESLHGPSCIIIFLFSTR
jgi:hypothetical protein